MIDILNRIEGKVNQVYDIVVGGKLAGPINQRVERIEHALFSGSGAGLIINSAAIAEVLRSTNFEAGVSGWEIQKSGRIEIQEAIVRGDITADSGFFSGTVYVGASNPRIIIDGVNKVIQSENYVAGQSGFRIDSNGVIEARDIIARGSIKASVFSYGEVNATAGSQYIVPSASTLKANTPTIPNDTETTFDIDINDPESAHTQLFFTGDILRIKDAANDTWLEVTAVSDQTSFYRYTVKRRSGSASLSYNKGTAVLNYGHSGDGGIWLNADQATGPFIQVFTHTGSPWSTIAERVRIGNLNGWGSFTDDRFGFALGDYSSGNYILYDPQPLTTGDYVTISFAWGMHKLNYRGIHMEASGDLPTMIEWGGLYGSNTAGIDPPTAAWVQASSDVGLEGSIWYGYNSINVTSFKPDNLQPGHKWVGMVFLQAGIGPSGSGNQIAVRGAQPLSGLPAIYDAVHIVGNAGVFISGGVLIGTDIGGTTPAQTAGYLTLGNGASVNEFSTDGTLAGNSDNAVPTEKAVATFVGTLDKAKVSKLRQSDDGGDALTADASGNLTTTANIYMADNGDIYPKNDIAGLWYRTINFHRSNPLEHWGRNADEASWTGWASYTGFVTPNNIAYADSALGFYHTSSGRKFRYRPFINAQTILVASVAPETAGEAGIMVDDGVNAGDGQGANNFIRWFIEAPSGNWNFAVERRTGGGAVTKTTYGSLPPANFYGIALLYGAGTRWSNWTGVWYVIGTSTIFGFTSMGSVSGQAWTPARIGIYGGNNANARSIFDWYTEI